MITKKICLYEKFVVSNQNFINEHVKIVKNSRFSRFLGFLATLYKGYVINFYQMKALEIK